MDGSNEEKPKLRRAVLERTVTLMLGGFALVAALAWNDAIQTLFNYIFGSAGSLIAKFGYAIIVTIIVTIISIRLSRWGREK